MINLDHINIVRYLGSERKEKILNIFLEFIPGGSIHSLLTKFKRFGEKVIQSFTQQILFGLLYLHEHRIVHRGFFFFFLLFFTFFIFLFFYF